MQSNDEFKPSLIQLSECESIHVTYKAPSLLAPRRVSVFFVECSVAPLYVYIRVQYSSNQS
jgi:hypothetical protein